MSVRVPRAASRYGAVALASIAIVLFPCDLALAQVVDPPASEPVKVDAKEAEAFFESKVRPLLIEKCLDCHSHETEVSGGLSLDSKLDWAKGGDSGPAIDEKSPEKSLFLEAIAYRNPKLRMPPDGKLSESELAILQRWINSGARDPRVPKAAGRTPQVGMSLDDARSHWSYRPIASEVVVPPGVATSPIDAFLERTRRENALSASPVAGLETLSRRVHLDLTGLRPLSDLPADDVRRWTVSRDREDRTPSAGEMSGLGSTGTEEDRYRRLVDELLASPRFGEHFARHWMDVIRFSESLTLRGLVFEDAWRYRQYLIDSFNADKPYDRFVREQIAGDLMDAPSVQDRQQQWIATTMLVLGDTNMEEQDKKQLEMDFIDEQIEVLGRAFLGQTLGCARCHDHKFDPIPTSDYYALAGILKSSKGIEHDNVSKWVRRPLPLPDHEEAQFLQADADAKKWKKQLETLKSKLSTPATSSSIVKPSELPGLVLDEQNARRIGKWVESDFVKPYVGSGYLHDDNDRGDVKSIVFEPAEMAPGEYELRMAYTASANRSTRTKVRIWSANGEDVVHVNQKVAPKVDGLWHSLGKFTFELGGKATVTITNENADGHVIVDAVQFLSDGPNKASAPVTPPGTAMTESEIEAIKKEIAELERKAKEAAALLAQRPMSMGLIPVPEPKDIPIHVRGSVHSLGAVVPRGFLRCVEVSDAPTLAAESNGRLELAAWIASRQNPLTARVYVNRVWYWLMGEGLIPSVDNFGTTGESSAHIELLDWLATQFMERGWSTKWLVREILMSDAYRRSATEMPEHQALDPDNKYFGRRHLKRMSGESIRDTLLGLSGSLDLSVVLSMNSLKAVKEDYGFQHRERFRAVYGPWFRNSLPTLFTEFDGPNPSYSSGERYVSTVAPQALAILNSPFTRECAESMAKQLAAPNGSAAPADRSIEERIEILFRWLLSRSATAGEVALAREWISRDTPDEWERFALLLIASVDFRYLD
ncbi:Xanthan lyase precursor [Pirellula sp. SH-Sr6A]|uniref:DUF1553 domain-containing protein n=1 Tax=Pirellula sp. SH-Sr6A TaxID=1632865 RepID=UPI00078D6463|nr:DUF1553 domain-containing protein [Pirellula sp. SH-Sr6A]AMV30606.1 Xanthan lyase precursor [Pirellula sp. SH-Sr6A]